MVEAATSTLLSFSAAHGRQRHGFGRLRRRHFTAAESFGGYGLPDGFGNEYGRDCVFRIEVFLCDAIDVGRRNGRDRRDIVVRRRASLVGERLRPTPARDRRSSCDRIVLKQFLASSPRRRVLAEDPSSHNPQRCRATSRPAPSRRRRSARHRTRYRDPPSDTYRRAERPRRALCLRLRAHRYSHERFRARRTKFC